MRSGCMSLSVYVHVYMFDTGENKLYLPGTTINAYKVLLLLKLRLGICQQHLTVCQQ